MYNKKNYIYILFLLLLGLNWHPARAADLKLYQNYQQHSNIEECNVLESQWEKCMNSPCDSNFSSETEREARLCYIQIAVQNNDSAICAKNLKGSNQADCLTELSIKNQDPGYCDKINEIDFSQNSNAISISPRDNPKIISLNRCYYYVATNIGDLSFCDKIHELDTGFRDTCFILSANKRPEAVAKNPGLCAGFPNVKGHDQRDDCYNIAFNAFTPGVIDEVSKNPEICGKYPEKFKIFRDQCYEQIYQRLKKPDMGAFLATNPSVCSGFDISHMQLCYESSFNDLLGKDKGLYLAQNAELCSQYPGDIKDKCYPNALEIIANKKLSNDFCEKFTQDNLVNKNIFSHISQALGFQPLINNASSREGCYMKTGVNLSDFSQNNGSFLSRNITGVFILLVIFLSNAVMIFIGIRKKSKKYLLILGMAIVIQITLLYILFLNSLFIDVIYFYPLFLYIEIAYFVSMAICTIFVFRKKEVFYSQIPLVQ